jgi:hypothetical protein
MSGTLTASMSDLKMAHEKGKRLAAVMDAAMGKRWDH